MFEPLAPSCQYIWKLHRPLVPNIFPQLEDEGYVWSLTFDLEGICYVLKDPCGTYWTIGPLHMYISSAKKVGGVQPIWNSRQNGNLPVKYITSNRNKNLDSIGISIFNSALQLLPELKVLRSHDSWGYVPRTTNLNPIWTIRFEF